MVDLIADQPNLHVTMQIGYPPASSAIKVLKGPPDKEFCLLNARHHQASIATTPIYINRRHQASAISPRIPHIRNHQRNVVAAK